MEHFGTISADRLYTLAEFALLIQFSREEQSLSAKVRHSTIRKNLEQIGCPTAKFGRTTLVSGRQFLLAVERAALQEFDDNHDEGE